MKPCLVIGSGFHNWVTGKVQHPTDITQWFEPSALSSTKIELRAKSAVMKVLQAQAEEYPHKSGRARFPFNAAFGAVISLNFDHAWVGKSNYSFANKHSKDTGSKKLTAVEIERLRNFMLKHEMPNKCIWFPNGSVCAPETIRMGLYDYGTQAHALQVAFSGIKAMKESLSLDWARRIGKRKV